jgi:hypothetical protein
MKKVRSPAPLGQQRQCAERKAALQRDRMIETMKTTHRVIVYDFWRQQPNLQMIWASFRFINPYTDDYI